MTLYSLEIIFFHKNVITELKKYSKLEHMKVEHLNFLDVRQTKDRITIDQNLFHLYPP